MNANLSILHLVLNASFVVQLVMLLLVAVSVASWAAIFRKLFALKRVAALNEAFEREFWSGTSLNDLYAAAAQNAKTAGPMERIFASGMREFQKLRERHIKDAGTLMDGARRAMRASYQRELDVVESNLSFLASVGSVSPYVGLFGTVWGIMHAFTGLASLQQVTLATVAPASPRRWWPPPLACLRPSRPSWPTTGLRTTSTAWPTSWKPSSRSFPTSCNATWAPNRPRAAEMAPTLATACAAQPPEGAGLAWGGPALRRPASAFRMVHPDCSEGA
jgi:biopolymer transport protein TolQ